MASVFGAMLEGANIMRQQNIDPIEPKALEIVLKCAHYSVVAVVIDDIKWQRINHTEVHRIFHRTWFQKTPDLIR